MAAVIALSAFETYELVRPQGLAPLSDRSRAASRGLVRVGFEINHKAGEEWAALANGKDGQGGSDRLVCIRDIRTGLPAGAAAVVRSQSRSEQGSGARGV